MDLTALTATSGTVAGMRPRLPYRSGRPSGRGRRRGLTLVELAVVLVAVAGMVALFASVPSGDAAADDRAAQTRLDAVANAAFNLYRPGASTSEMTVADLAVFTGTPLTAAAIDPAVQRDAVSVAFTATDPASPMYGVDGYVGAAALGRTGSCFYLRVRLGPTGVAGGSEQAAWLSFDDFFDGAGDPSDTAAAAACTGEDALEADNGGPSWAEAADRTP